jgi:hypothetical protein
MNVRIIFHPLEVQFNCYVFYYIIYLYNFNLYFPLN